MPRIWGEDGVLEGIGEGLEVELDALFFFKFLFISFIGIFGAFIAEFLRSFISSVYVIY